MTGSENLEIALDTDTRGCFNTSMSNTPQKMMTLKCRHGEGHEWTRPSQRGKPPHYCPEHTPAGADNKVGARKRLPQPKAPAHLETMGKLVVANGNDMTPAQALAEVQEKKKRELTPEHKAKLAEGRERKARERAEAESARRAEAVERMVAQMPTLDERWNAAFDTACKENTREAWNRADAAQMAMLNTRAAIRKGVTI